METRHKILLVDDDPDLLEMYREILSQLPSRPEVHTASSGARAMAVLESGAFRLLISDLKMPKMDGLQLLSVVRRKHPELRTVVLTSVADEQFRSRVYALGVDLFWQKPANEHEIKMFRDCIESLLDRNDLAGFRGVQSKSLVDIIQLECITHSSSILRITNGALSGKIWIDSGELVDAETDDTRGEDAFLRILAWKAGSFETMPGEASRARTIFKSYNALLLETAQALDEAASGAVSTNARPATSGVAAAVQVDGVEFVLSLKVGEPGKFEARGLENPDRLEGWTRQCLERFRALGERLQAGPFEQIEALGPQRHVAVAQSADTALCVGWRPALTGEEVRERMKKVVTLWAS
ncbi:MAG: response regulator [Pedosphaera sp.]|nr:response regulator [Pedosphaera sp.]